MAPGENNKATMSISENDANEESVLSEEQKSDETEQDFTVVEEPVEEAVEEEEDTQGTEVVSSTRGAPDEYADEPDETLSERLWGLTEMFPDTVRSATSTVTKTTSCGLQCLYSLSRNLVWIFVSSSVILFAPLIFEVERAQMEDVQRSQQKQMLLGPNTAVSGGQGLPMPPIHR